MFWFVSQKKPLKIKQLGVKCFKWAFKNRSYFLWDEPHLFLSFHFFELSVSCSMYFINRLLWWLKLVPLYITTATRQVHVYSTIFGHFRSGFWRKVLLFIFWALHTALQYFFQKSKQVGSTLFYNSCLAFFYFRISRVAIWVLLSVK